MVVKVATQYTVFLEHKVGALASVVLKLKESDINIIAASGSASSDGGILRIVVEKETDEIKNIFRNLNLYPVKSSVIILNIYKKDINDLSRALTSLADNNVNLHSIFWSSNNRNNILVIALVPDKFEKAMRILEEL